MCVLIVIDDKSLSSQSLLKSESLLCVCVNLCGNVTTRKQTDGVRELNNINNKHDLKQIHTQKHA